jgi:hypothetical protein
VQHCRRWKLTRQLTGVPDPSPRNRQKGALIEVYCYKYVWRSAA